MKIAICNKQAFSFLRRSTLGLNTKRIVTSVVLAFFNQKFGAQAEHGIFT